MAEAPVSEALWPFAGRARWTGGRRWQGPLPRGAAGALLAGLLLLLSLAGPVPLLVGVALLQVALLWSYTELVGVPGRPGVLALGLLAAGGADAAVRLDHGRVGHLAAVVALALILALPVQLARRGHRDSVTASLSHALAAAVLGVGSACLLSPSRHGGLVQTALAAAAAALLLGRLVDAVAPRPALVAGASRGWPGLVLGAGAATAVASVARHWGSATALHQAVLLGLATGLAVAAADLFVDLAAVELREGAPEAALQPVGVLLPLAVVGPVVVLAVRLGWG